MTFVFALVVLTALAVLCGVVLLAHPADAVVSVTPSGISPANATTGQAYNVPIPLKVTVVVNNAPHVTINWYSSPTGLAGTWTLRHTAANVHNGTHSYNCTWNNGYYTVYYWRITYTTTAGTTGAVYHFTTRDSTMLSQGDRDDLTVLIIWAGFMGILLTIVIFVIAMIKGRFGK
jgi:hypothetical protein